MRGARPNTRNAEAGVTLVEILVVLSIIAITTGAAMLRLGLGRPQDDFGMAVQAMALAVTAASDAAMQSGQDRVLELGPQGYRLMAEGSGAQTQWQTIPGLSFQTAGGQIGALRLSADGAAPPFDLRLADGGQTAVLRFDGLTAEVEATP